MKKGNFQLRAEENKQSKIRLKKMKNEIKLQEHFIKYLTQKVTQIKVLYIVIKIVLTIVLF